MNDRRSFLKLFGIGAAIVPVAASGAPLMDQPARIIEPPKVDLIRPEQMVTEPINLMGMLESGETVGCSVVLTTSKGTTMVLRGQSILVSATPSCPVDVTDHRQLAGWRQFAPGPLPEITWTVRGVFTGPVNLSRR